MKSITYSTIFFICTLFLFSCDREDVVLRTADCGDDPVEVQGSCYEDRATVETFHKESGRVVQLNPEVFAIVPDRPGTVRVGPCNLPASLQSEGQRVFFSGELKETYPTENWAAMPFSLTCISR